MYAPIPDGEVKILKGVPLDLNYINTIYFASSGAQSAYFSGLQKYGYTRLYYIRETARVQVPITADSLFDCNYLMYRNQQYVDKWFYAFIKQVYYINDNTCEIEFELDVLQTWAFDYQIKPSFIERNHTVTDVIGDNDVAENLDIGTYIQYQVDKCTDMGNMFSVVMFSTFDVHTLQSAGGSLNGGSYSALERTVIGQFSLDNNGNAAWVADARTAIADIVNNHADLVDGVVAIVIVPTAFENYSLLYWRFNKLSSIPNYTVRNKKLFTAPFYAIYVSDGSGSGKMYAPDKFAQISGATGDISFQLRSDLAPSQTVIAQPQYYKSTAALQTETETEAIFMTGFPQAAWVSDAFKQYLAQNQTNLGITTAIGLGQIVAGAITTVVSEGAAAPIGIGMITGGISTVAGLVADLNDKSKRPPEVHGNVTGTAYMRMGKKTFIAYHLMPDLEHLKIIDDYFDMYGYAIHEVGVPNISSRPHWNYVKLQNANIIPAAGSGVNAADLKKIADIFNRGVTFWKNGSEVGDYTLNNTV